MDTVKIDVKILTADGAHPPLAEFVPVFHTFIQQRRVPNELLIDVANYAHVPDGPGVMLIGHEGNYSLDLMGGEPGLLYSQRRPTGVTSFAEALTRAVRQALLACSLLEQESTFSRALRFSGDRWLIHINDRLQAPNEAASWERVEPLARAALRQVLGDEPTLSALPPGRERFGFRVTQSKQQSAAELLARVSAQS